MVRARYPRGRIPHRTKTPISCRVFPGGRYPFSRLSSSRFQARKRLDRPRFYRPPSPPLLLSPLSARSLPRDCACTLIEWYPLTILGRKFSFFEEWRIRRDVVLRLLCGRFVCIYIYGENIRLSFFLLRILKCVCFEKIL